MPLYKDKNFNLDIVLKDKNGEICKNHQEIHIVIELYTSEEKPILIKIN